MYQLVSVRILEVMLDYIPKESKLCIEMVLEKQRLKSVFFELEDDRFIRVRKVNEL